MWIKIVPHMPEMPMHFSGNTMSRTVAFGRDVLSAPDVDIEVHYVEWKRVKNKK
jgi:hypothetical protein